MDATMHLPANGGELFIFLFGVVNLIGVIVNLFFVIKLKGTQVSKELLENLTDQNKAKDELIFGYKEEIHKLKFHKATCEVKHA